MPKIHYSMLLMVTGLICWVTAHAEIFKWVDANGITHYSDSAPPNRKSQALGLGGFDKQAATTNVKLGGTSQQKTSEPRRAKVAKHSIRQVSYSQPPLLKKFSFKNNLKHQAKAAVVTEKPNLDAAVYDLRKAPKVKKLRDIKQKLCSEKRMLLAALQEKGFNGYYDEVGNYRLAWGGDGIYQGKRLFLDESVVIRKTAKVRFEIEQYCDDPHNQKRQETARANWIRAEYCALSKAILDDLKHPFMRATDERIDQQTEEVERLCSPLAPGRYRNDRRYYPAALVPKATLPRHLTVKEEGDTSDTPEEPKETLEQLLALIE